MKTLRLLALALPLLAANPAVQARGSVPIQEFENVSATRASGQPASAMQIKAGFEAAARARGWQVSTPSPDKMIATLHVRGKHTVSTEINYAPGTYTVKYKDSVNMNFEPPNMIHPFYNKWVQLLVDTARSEIASK